MITNSDGWTGHNFRAAREWLRLTQKNFCRELEKILKKKVSTAQISRIEDGKRTGRKLPSVREAMIGFFMDKGIDVDSAGNMIFVD